MHELSAKSKFAIVDFPHESQICSRTEDIFIQQYYISHASVVFNFC